MNDHTWQLIDADYGRFPVMHSDPATDEEIGTLRQALPGLPFPPDYLAFLRRYGGGVVGSLPVFGVRTAEVMGKGETLIDQNRHFREQSWPGIEQWLIVSNDGFGNPLGIAPDGQVWVSDHDRGQVVPIASSFEEFLLRWCLGVRARP